VRRASPIATSKVCSTLANLLYWQASAEELGSDRFREVLTRAERMTARP
jgi:hypothetical protein